MVGAALRVKIDDRRTEFSLGCAGGHVNGDGGFPADTFLSDNR
jgi:hypothetical protein